MKNKLILVSTLMLALFGISSAQYCPSPNSSRNGYNNYGFNNYGVTNSNAYFALNDLAFDFNSALRRGRQSDELTQKELWQLENAYDRVLQKVDRAYRDGRMTYTEWTFIEFDINNLKRDLRRSLNNDDRKVS